MYIGNDAIPGYAAQQLRQDYALGSSVVGSTRQYEVPLEMEKLKKQVASVHVTLEQLEGRLGFVRRQCPVSVCDKAQAGAPEPVLCGMANEIRTTRKQLEGIEACLLTLLQEIEL